MISHPELPIVSFLAAFLVLIPLPWHWRARNVATLSMIGWLFVVNFLRGLSTIFWADNIDIKYQPFCDILTRLTIGIAFAMPGVALCICRYLAGVASATAGAPTASSKRKRLIFEMIMCNGLPCLFMALHYIVQGHRFDIQEHLGCAPATYLSWPALVILWVPVLLLCVITMIYAAMALRFFILRRIEFGLVLDGASSSLTSGRYLRLIGLAVTEILWGTSLGCYVIYLNLSQGALRVYDNWDHVHSDFGRIDRYPARLIPKFFFDRILLSWWVIPSTAILFFLFFGFGQEAMKEYRTSLLWFRRNVLRQEVASQKTMTSMRSMPTQMRVKLDELDAISMSGYDPKWDAPPTSSASVSSFAKAREGGKENDAGFTHRSSLDSPQFGDAIHPDQDNTITPRPRTDNIV
jgi:pheromone a factor receptor